MRFHVATIDEFPAAGDRKLVDVSGRRLAVFRTADGWVALDNHCPHRGGPVAAGPLEQGCLTCPWHGWTFRLGDGMSVSGGNTALTRYPVQVEDDGVFVVLDEPDDIACRLGDRINVLVQYGKPGHVGWFACEGNEPPAHGTQVVVRTGRGLQRGHVLAGRRGRLDPSEPGSQRPEQRSKRPEQRSISGTIERLWDAELAQQEPNRLARAAAVLEDCHVTLGKRRISLTVLDAEPLVGEDVVVVYFLGEGAAELGPVAVEVAERCGCRRIQFEAWRTADDALPRHVATQSSKQAAGGDEEETMRGPYERLKYDLRRVWECPVCQHRERSSGSVTSFVCRCQDKEPPTKRVCMKLVEDGPRRV